MPRRYKKCKNYDACHQMIPVKDCPSRGRERECCSEKCRQAVSRRERAKKSQEEQPEEACLCPPILQKHILPVLRTHILPKIQIMLDHIITIQEGVYHCKLCGWSWSEPPTRYCPRGRIYTEEERPNYLFTLSQLRERGLRPGTIPDAFVFRAAEPGWDCLYDINKAQPDVIVIRKAVPDKNT